MNYEPIDWDSIPEILSKEQFYKLCHISKSTARYLLVSGKVPCIQTGKKTRCYQIRREDVRAFLHRRGIQPEQYTSSDKPDIIHFPTLLHQEISPALQDALRGYLEKKLKKELDLLTARQIASITGYSPSIVNQWCRNGQLACIKKGGRHYIPKSVLLDYLCSMRFRTIVRKTPWHIETFMAFHRSRASRICTGTTKKGGEQL